MIEKHNVMKMKMDVQLSVFQLLGMIIVNPWVIELEFSFFFFYVNDYTHTLLWTSLYTLIVLSPNGMVM